MWPNVRITESVAALSQREICNSNNQMCLMLKYICEEVNYIEHWWALWKMCGKVRPKPRLCGLPQFQINANSSFCLCGNQFIGLVHGSILTLANLVFDAMATQTHPQWSDSLRILGTPSSHANQWCDYILRTQLLAFKFRNCWQNLHFFLTSAHYFTVQCAPNLMREISRVTQTDDQKHF